MQSIPRELDQLVQAELERGEKVLWKEMPIKRYFTPKSTGAFLFGIPWTAFALFWTAGASGFQFPDFKEGFDLFPLFGLPFILIGLGMLSSPLWAYWKAGKSIYVITDSRAVTIEGGRSMTIRSYPPEKLQHLYRKQKKNGTGDVIISVKQWKDSDGDKRSDELGFIGVRNPKEVEQILKTLAEQVASRDPDKPVS